MAGNNEMQIPVIYKYGLLFSFVSTLSPWFLWRMEGFVIIPFFITTVYALIKTPHLFRLNKNNIIVIYFLFLFFCSLGAIANFNGYIANFINFLGISSIVCLREKYKIEILNFITQGFAIIISLSFIAFILTFALNLSLPYESVTYAGVYQLRNFHLFLTAEWDSPFIFPRFQSVFAEPGHLGMISSFLLFVESFNLKKWYNIVILLCALFTMSLASYVLMIIGIILLVFVKYKHLIIYLIIALIFSGSIIAIINNIFGEYNIFNQLIVERLAFEDGEFVGNNRFSSDFENDYNRKVKTSAVWLGWLPVFYLYDGGNAGYKRYISDYGLIGLFICIVTYLSFCKGYPKKYACSMLLLYAASFLQRAYPFWTSELIIFICGLSLMSSNITKYDGK